MNREELAEMLVKQHLEQRARLEAEEGDVDSTDQTGSWNF